MRTQRKNARVIGLSFGIAPYLRVFWCAFEAVWGERPSLSYSDLSDHIKSTKTDLLLEFPNKIDRIWNLRLFVCIRNNMIYEWKVHYLYSSLINWKQHRLGFNNWYWFIKRIYSKIEKTFFYPALAYFVVYSGLRCHCGVEHEKRCTVSSSVIIINNKSLNLCDRPVSSLLKMKMRKKIEAIKYVLQLKYKIKIKGNNRLWHHFYDPVKITEHVKV